MAKVTGPLLSTYAEGSVGPLTFGVDKGIQTVRKKPESKYFSSPLRDLDEEAMQYANDEWGKLNKVEQDLWEQRARGIRQGFGGRCMFISKALTTWWKNNRPEY